MNYDTDDNGRQDWIRSVDSSKKAKKKEWQARKVNKVR